jgi:protein-S-isoprenylcysteine O-methyltransferase Ste14
MSIADRLARWRVPFGFLFGAVVLWLAAPTPNTLAAGVPIAVAGEALRLWAAGHLNKSREVTASGPYRWFAHPLYVGSSVIGAGLAVASGSVVVAALVALYLTVLVTAAIRSEEAFLRRRFGDRYDRYRRGARSELERDEAAARTFRWAQAVANREHRAMAGLLLAVLLLVLKATYNGVLAR